MNLAKVIRLAAGHHRPDLDNPAAAILDLANRIASAQEELEAEEMQPVIPPQVPMVSILWHLSHNTNGWPRPDDTPGPEGSPWSTA